MTDTSTQALETLDLTRRVSASISGHRGGSYRGIEPAAMVVAAWHDETHPGAFSTCQDQPCAAVRRVDG